VSSSTNDTSLRFPPEEYRKIDACALASFDNPQTKEMSVLFTNIVSRLLKEHYGPLLRQLFEFYQQAKSSNGLNDFSLQQLERLTIDDNLEQQLKTPQGLEKVFALRDKFNVLLPIIKEVMEPSIFCSDERPGRLFMQDVSHRIANLMGQYIKDAELKGFDAFYSTRVLDYGSFLERIRIAIEMKTLKEAEKQGFAPWKTWRLFSRFRQDVNAFPEGPVKKKAIEIIEQLVEEKWRVGKRTVPEDTEKFGATW
jgi:hypothetical protein